MESLEKEFYCIGVDIGGTKIAVSLGNEKGVIIEKRRVATQPFGGAEKALPHIIEMIRDLLRDHDLELLEIKAIGLSLPGPISISQGKILRPPNLPGWVDVPILQYFREKLNRPIFMNNDGNGGALAEWLFGGIKGAKDLVYLTMSTGIGGGIIAEGRLLQGRNDIAGEVGHFVLDPKGPPCLCGQRGCFEVYCGGRSLSLFMQKKLKEEKIKSCLLEEAEGKLERIDMAVLLKGVKRKDLFAQHVWSEFIERLAQGIGTLLMTINPEAVILGTIATSAHEYLMEPLLKALPRYAWAEARDQVKIVPSTLGNQIGEIGSIAIAIEGLLSQDI